MTATARWTDDRLVGHALGVVLAGVEATLRADPAVDTCLMTLHEMGETGELLAAISIATLDQLGDVLEGGRIASAGDLAAALLDRAVQFGLAPPSAVHAAAARLEVFVRGDRWRLTAELRRSRTANSDGGLVNGAVALLAAVIDRSAQRQGLAPELMAERLCLAASSPQPT